MARLAERVAEPLKTFVETITRGGTSRLDVLEGWLAWLDVSVAMLSYPGALSQAVKAKLVCNLRGVHGILHVELVFHIRSRVDYD